MKTNLIDKQEITYQAGDQTITGDLVIPANAKAIVIFCHGINSSRHSPRNIPAADLLNHSGIATLLISIEKIDEDLFLKGSNLHVLSNRFADITRAVLSDSRTEKLSIGYFGSGTGAAVVLAASTKFQHEVKAIVCRGGRPEEAVALLDQVKAVTLLICGENDKEGIALNEMTKDHLKVSCELKIIPGASRLFEERGKLGEAAQLALDWYYKHLLPSAEKQPHQANMQHIN